MGFEIWYPMCRPGVGDKHFLPPANEVWGKVIFSVAYVKNSVHGGSASVHAGIAHPTSDQALPRPDIPSPPPPPGTRPRPRPCTPRADNPPGTRHPLRSACWKIRSTSGWYASYWTAILFRISYLTKCLVHWKLDKNITQISHDLFIYINP